MLDANQRLAAIWGAFIQEKQPHVCQNNELCVFSLATFPYSPPQHRRRLKIQRPGGPQRGQSSWELLQGPILRELALFDLPDGSLEDPSCKAALFDLTQSCLVQIAVSSGCALQVIRSNAITAHHCCLR